jgi:hypothetical protein
MKTIYFDINYDFVKLPRHYYANVTDAVVTGEPASLVKL